MKDVVPASPPTSQPESSAALSGTFAIRLGVAVAALLLLVMFILLGRVALQQSDTMQSLQERPVSSDQGEAPSVSPAFPPAD